jgi:superoxide dismutase, Fe-Mn family
VPQLSNWQKLALYTKRLFTWVLDKLPKDTLSGGKLMKHELPPLPYEMDALEPYISAETLEYHYGKHHKKYVDTLNELIPGTQFENKTLEQIISTASSGPIFNNAAQVWNHTFYWNCLSPEGGGKPTGSLAEVINKTFGSFESFKEKFTTEATQLFGSGWVWLVKDTDSSISIEQSSNAVNPLQYGRVVLMTCDMWEHAYYIDYRNAKAKYLEAFWNRVNWDFVAGNFQA